MANEAMTIDDLQIRISANAKSAVTSLNSLAKSLAKVRNALEGSTDKGITAADALTSSLQRMNGVFDTINTSNVKKLQKMANALNDYATACKRIKGESAGVAKQIANISSKLDTKSGLTASAGGKSSVGGSGSGGTDADDDIMDAKWKQVKKQATFLTNFVKSIGRIAMYRAIRSAMKAVTEAFDEGLKRAYAFSKQTEGFHRLAEDLDRIKSLSYQMTSQLGAAFAGLKQFVQPVIEWIIEKLRVAAEWITEFFAALNGDDYYMVAKYVQKSWDGATDSLKKYKKQLLGLDELNNLSAKNDEEDYTAEYEKKAVRPGLKKLGDEWRGVVKVVSDALAELSDILVPALGIIGAILLFTGHPVLGIGCIIGGIALWGSKAKEDSEYNEGMLSGKLEGIMNTIKENVLLVALGLGVIGTILLFTGHLGLGLGMLIGGIGLWAGKMKEDEPKWTKVKKKLEKYMNAIKDNILLVALGLGVLGVVLLFTGHLGLGLGFVIAGLALWGSKAKKEDFKWSKIENKLTKVFESIRDNLIWIALGLGVLGVVMLFTGHFGLGIGMLLASGMIAQYEVSELGWDGVLKQLKDAWKDIKDWWDRTVMDEARIRIRELEEEWNIDLNGDGKIGFGKAGLVTVGTKQLDDPFKPGEPTIKTPTAKDIALDRIQMAITRNKTNSSVGSTVSSSSNDNTSWLGQVWDDTKKDFDLWASQAGWYDIIIPFTGKTLGDYIAPKAGGGLVGQGSLFYAGEAGPEFVGSMGGSSAVANTEQMTEAIYKAAYMGMSKALQENGGGMNGFVPATTDDLFIAMRKKASNYNKMTGNSAFA